MGAMFAANAHKPLSRATTRRTCEKQGKLPRGVALLFGYRRLAPIQCKANHFCAFRTPASTCDKNPWGGWVPDELWMLVEP
jgi:hypothetical protein